MGNKKNLWLILIVFLISFVGFIFIAIKGDYLANIRRLIPETRHISPGFYRVVEIYDGDTIAVDMAGTIEKVRFIGIDTPETHKPNAAVQCFGEEASKFTSDLLSGSTVRLESDPTNTNRDRYNRLLRYVYTEDGRLVEQLIIEGGYGFAYTPFPFEKKPNFVELQKTAQQKLAGLWSACDVTEKDGIWHTNDVE